MDTLLIPFLNILFILLALYVKVIIVAVIFSWLIMFNVLNTSNHLVYLINDILTRLTEPGFKLFRRFIPPLGSVDLSPLFLFLAVQFLQMVIVRIMMRL